jgi:hypothetical protein
VLSPNPERPSCGVIFRRRALGATRRSAAPTGLASRETPSVTCSPSNVVLRTARSRRESPRDLTRTGAPESSRSARRLDTTRHSRRPRRRTAISGKRSSISCLSASSASWLGRGSLIRACSRYRRAPAGRPFRARRASPRRRSRTWCPTPPFKSLTCQDQDSFRLCDNRLPQAEPQAHRDRHGRRVRLCRMRPGTLALKPATP